MKTRKQAASTGLISVVVHRLFAWLTSLLIFIVSLGPIPQHVAFVMDGNRRYARGKGQKARDGHSEGFESLKRVSSCRSPMEVSGMGRSADKGLDIGDLPQVESPSSDGLCVFN